MQKEMKDWRKNSLFPYWEIPKNKLLIERAKGFRKRGVLAEVLFWQTFKDKKEIGYDIDRQVIIGNYIVDFFMPELGLVFEIDDASHKNKKEYDLERDAFMGDYKLKVIRISDLEIKRNMSKVYKFVIQAIKERKQELKFPS
jgi:very-short-patch-repair endonuclease